MPIDYRFSGGSYIGASPIIQVDTVVPAYASDASKMRLGSTSIGVDFGTSNYGEAEFRYIKFTGAVVAGDIVLSDASGKRGVQAASGAVATVRGTVGRALASPANATTNHDRGCISN